MTAATDNSRELYDRYAFVQRLAAADLVAFTGDVSARRILEPGCGTGIYTAMLAEAFPGAAIDAVDISAEMLRIAEARLLPAEVALLHSDAESLDGGPYDLITSNAALQWFHRLEETLARYAAMLAPRGVLTFSFFGPATYCELDDALVAATDGRARAAAAAFHDRGCLEAAMRAGYCDVLIEERCYAREFPTLAELLRCVRYTRTRGRGAGLFWTNGLLKRVEAAYRARHGAIRATYEVYLCRGAV